MDTSITQDLLTPGNRQRRNCRMKTLITLALLALSINAFTQDIEYCEISFRKGGTVFLCREGENTKLRDDNGKVINNSSEALQQMAKYGWRFLASYETEEEVIGLTTVKMTEVTFILYREKNEESGE
ncbi:hypothetical protein ES705_38018 [subsurface metagenome]